jgi:hypothetical protein
MAFRTAGAIATLVIGLGGAGGQALAQYYPPPDSGQFVQIFGRKENPRGGDVLVKVRQR